MTKDPYALQFLAVDGNASERELEQRMLDRILLADRLGPVQPDTSDPWFNTGVFPAKEEGSLSPLSRRQDVDALGELISSAARGEVEWASKTLPEVVPMAN